MKKKTSKVLSTLVSTVLAVGTTSVNSPSLAIYHQPAIPEKILKQKKY